MTKSWEEIYARAAEAVGNASEAFGETIDALKEAYEAEYDAKKVRKLLELEKEKKKHAMTAAQSLLKSMK